MQDEFHDVRLNIVSHAGLICEVLSVDGLARAPEVPRRVPLCYLFDLLLVVIVLSLLLRLLFTTVAACI